MNILCFDISTGGLAAAVVDEQLQAVTSVEVPWHIAVQSDGAAVLDADLFSQTFAEVTTRITSRVRNSFDAISFSAFMHSCVVLDGKRRPVTPIFTWMDRRGSQEVEKIRNKLGSNFHSLTGCRYHPMFPVFKVESFDVPSAGIVVSAKSLALAALTGILVEDHGTASATGFYDVHAAGWSEQILDLIGLRRDAFPPIVERNAIVGHTTLEAVTRLGLATGIPVVAGSGDGFLANAGSGCDHSDRIAVTLGTSSSARLILRQPVFDEAAGTFCYRAHREAFLLGCASSNGGNVLDWAKSVFGERSSERMDRGKLPTFIPLLNGERSPDWNESLAGSWHGIRSHHTGADLAASVVDGVIFNLAHYLDILAGVSGISPGEIILSGNGFLYPATASILASVVEARVLQPRYPGLASIRGAATCALQGLSVDPRSALERIVAESEVIAPEMEMENVRRRYLRYRERRAVASGNGPTER